MFELCIRLLRQDVNFLQVYSATIGATCGTRPLQLWGSWGPSIFGPLQLLQLIVVHSLGRLGSLTNFPNLL